jgi:hypothetical protein
VSGQRHAPAALYPRGKDLRYPLDRRLGRPQSWSGHRARGKSIASAGHRILAVLSVVRHCTDWAIPAPVLFVLRFKTKERNLFLKEVCYINVNLIGRLADALWKLTNSKEQRLSWEVSSRLASQEFKSIMKPEVLLPPLALVEINTVLILKPCLLKIRSNKYPPIHTLVSQVALPFNSSD